MAQEKPNKLAEWVVAVRAHAPEVKRGLRAWIEQVRDEPILLWETPAIRYAVYGLVTVVLVWCVRLGVHAVTPPPPENARAAATTADFHVICTNPDCHSHFVIRREFGFRKFPVECPRCTRQTGQRAVLCTDEACTAQWVLPEDQP